MHKIKNLLNHLKEWFALLDVFLQLGVVALFGSAIVVLSGLFLGSVENSYMVFIDPPALSLMKDEPLKLFFSFLLMLFGIVVAGFIISVLSSWLESTLRDIKQGRLKYFGENHTLIINYNQRILKILDELNLLHSDNKDIHDIVILIGNESDLQSLHNSMQKQRYSHLNIYVRFGDTLSMARYNELSILSAYAIIILSDESISDSFVRDNHNLRITNLLYSKEELVVYLDAKRKKYTPVKAVVEFTDMQHFENILNRATNSHFLAIAPQSILSSIMNLSMINIDFYNTWSELLSFEGYELYFIDSKLYNLEGSSYRDALLRQKEGLLLGVSRTVDGKFTLLINKHEESIEKNDWLIMIAEDKKSISFNEKPLGNISQRTLLQPRETYTRNIVIIGNERELNTNELLDNKSKVLSVLPEMRELYKKEYFDTFLHPDAKIDTIIVNLDDESMYRVALNLKVYYSDEILKSFVFLVNNALIAEHLESAGFKNTILSHLLISKYIAQVSNQLALHRVFNTLFVKDGPEINFIESSHFEKNLLDDLDQLKVTLVDSKMAYLGCVTKEGKIVFEARDLSNVAKIIVISDGEY